ncbi:MAG: ATP-binding protein [Betaproteobacteria bacterium]|nr:ATP-binding protein [Betaproteobacteria bacterium]
MATAASGLVRRRLADKLADSLTAPLPAATPRRMRGTVSLPGKATAVIGMRRAGKTTFLHQLRRERLAAGVARERLPYINFEDEVLAGMQAAQLGFLLDEYYRRYPGLRARETVTWCFDEIQAVPGWERFVRRLLDTEQVEIFLSGSSAALLSREVATSMRGRGWEVLIHPFSFEEFLRHRALLVPEHPEQVSAAERSALEHHLLAYLETGGFPEAQALPPADRHELLLRYVDVAMLRDVMERHGVTNVAGLHWLVRHLLGNPGALFSVEKFHARLKSQGIAIARDTLHALLGYVEDCFLVRTLWVEAASERRRMVNPRKVHPVDPGLIPIFDQTGRANRGHALEAAVRVELERRRMQVTYVKTKEGYEVDFLARAPAQPPVLIQVAADLDEQATREREIRALLAAKAEHPRASLHLVTLAPESATEVPDSVQVHPAWSWFLAASPSEDRIRTSVGKP